MNLLLTIALGIASLLPKADDTFWRDSIPQEILIREKDLVKKK